MPDLSIEQSCKGIVAGIDEAGRGPWAGPVVAAAVILPDDLPASLRDGLDDSKKLKPDDREFLFAEIRANADYGIGAASVAEIARDNILAATFTAMRRAVARLDRLPATALVDGNKLPPNLPCEGRPIVKGDGLSLSIAVPWPHWAHDTPPMAGSGTRATAPGSTATAAPPPASHRTTDVHTPPSPRC